MAFTYIATPKQQGGRGRTSLQRDEIRLTTGIADKKGAKTHMWYLSIGLDVCTFAGIKLGDQISVAIDQKEGQMLLHKGDSGTTLTAAPSLAKQKVAQYQRVTRRYTDGLPRFIKETDSVTFTSEHYDVLKLDDAGHDAIIISLPPGMQYSAKHAKTLRFATINK